MANIHEYLIWRGDVPFEISPFNEVDGLVLSELAYANFSGVVADENESVTIEEARRRFWALHTPQEIMAINSYTKTAPFLMDEMAGKARFGGTILSNYYDVVDTDSDVQLSAITFHLPDGTVFVAFRGTDDTIVGWKEDFNMSYLPETEGQRRAVKYLNDHWINSSAPLRLGGHSKGGNLAVYAAVCAAPEIRNRIIAVYNNDGPGFLDAFTNTKAYKDMLPRIICIEPEDCVIGSLLSSEAYQHIVKSTSFGIVQHDGFSWEVLGTRFVEVKKRSELSVFLETTVRQWLSEQAVETRRTFVNTLFSLLASTGHENISEIKNDIPAALSRMKKMLDTMPREQRDKSWNMLIQLFSKGAGNLLQETRKGLMAVLENWTSAKPEKNPKPGEEA